MLCIEHLNAAIAAVFNVNSLTLINREINRLIKIALAIPDLANRSGLRATENVDLMILGVEQIHAIPCRDHFVQHPSLGRERHPLERLRLRKRLSERGG